MDEGPEAGVGLGIRDFPRKPSKDHAHENNSHAPYICFSGVVWIVAEDLWCEIGITTNDTSRWGVGLARVMEDSCGAKVDKFDDIVSGHDTVVKFEISVGQPQFV